MQRIVIGSRWQGTLYDRPAVVQVRDVIDYGNDCLEIHFGRHGEDTTYGRMLAEFLERFKEITNA